MTVAQLDASTSADGGGTCLHGLAAAGANTRNLLKYVLDRGGREMLEMTNARGETPVQCARVALEALKAEDEAAGLDVQVGVAHAAVRDAHCDLPPGRRRQVVGMFDQFAAPFGEGPAVCAAVVHAVLRSFS